MTGVIWGTGQVFLDILWFFLFLVQLWLMISVFTDLFRRNDMTGWMKALWVVMVIVFPLVGILLYLVFYGDKMRVHALQAAERREQELRHYVAEAAAPTGPATELTRLYSLKERGAITEEEFERLKRQVVATATKV